MQFYKNHKEWALTIFIGIIAAAIFIALSNHWPTPDSSKGYAESLNKVRPYVVNIHSSSQLTDKNNPLLSDPILAKYINTAPQTNLGSGILLGTEGLIVTNAHVIAKATNIVVETYDGQQAPALHYWVDEQNDIALIKTDINIEPSLPIGNYADTQVGDLAFTIGNPFGIGQSVSMGIVSATARNRSSLLQITDFIQTDANINPGNSGGALVNSQGKVIGMSSAVLTSNLATRSIGFAIPIAYVLNAAKELQSSPPMQPKVAGFVGIDVIGSPPEQPLRIVSIKEGGPAERAGLKLNDVIITIDDISFNSRQQLIQYVQSKPAHTALKFHVLRNGQQAQIKVSIAVR